MKTGLSKLGTCWLRFLGTYTIATSIWAGVNFWPEHSAAAATAAFLGVLIGLAIALAPRWA